MQTPKRRVFLIHLAISAAIAAALAALMYLRWFPGELFAIAGGWQGLKLILAVDLVLGPSLTLLFYRAGKKSAAFDLCLIALLQSLALGYGVLQAYEQRVAALAFAEGRFVAVPASALQLAADELRAAGKPVPELDALDSHRPAQIAVEPFDTASYGEYLADVMNGLPGLQERLDRYRPLVEGYAQIAPFALDRAQLDADARRRLDDCADCAAFRLDARYGSGVALVDAQRGRIRALLPAGRS